MARAWIELDGEQATGPTRIIVAKLSQNGYDPLESLVQAGSA